MRTKEAISFAGLLVLLAATVSARAAQEPEVGFYFGRSTVSLPNGRVVGSSESLIKREVSESLITERVVVIDPRPEIKPREFVVVMVVDGSKFRMNEIHDAFTGTGELIGEPGKWTAWNSRSLLPDGSVIESSDVLSEGNLLVEKKYLSADGQVRVLMNEVFPAITETEYQDRYSKLFPG